MTLAGFIKSGAYESHDRMAAELAIGLPAVVQAIALRKEGVVAVGWGLLSFSVYAAMPIVFRDAFQISAAIVSRRAEHS